MSVEPIAIIGAGPTGLSTAYHLKKNYTVWEKNSEVGGGCRTEKVNGFSFDYGGHIFYPKNENIRSLIFTLMENQLQCAPREAWIYSKHTYTRYPFQANLYGLPVKVVKECLMGLMKAKLEYGETHQNYAHFEDFIYKVFGEGMAKHFMIPFNRKQWAIPLKEMTTDWMGKFVPLPSLDEVLEGSLKQASRCSGINANFIYPYEGGIQAIFEAFVPHIQNLHLNSKVTSVSLKNKSLEVEGKKHFYEKLVATLPLPELIQILESPPTEVKEAAQELKWTSLYIVNVGVDRPFLSEKHRVYYPEEDFIFHKLGYYQNQSPQMVPPGKSAVSAEISFSPRRPIKKEQAVEKTVEDLKKARVLGKNDPIILTHVLTLPYAYALYDHKRKEAVSCIQEFLEKNDIYLCGRYAQWEYQNMEQNILAGKALAEKLN